MQFSKEEFIGDFVSESLEQLNIVDSKIIELKNSPQNLILAKEILRALHTIKGSSRMLGFSNVEQLSHALEDILKDLESQKYEINAQLTSVILACTNRLRTVLFNVEKNQNDNIKIQNHLATCKKIVAGKFFNLSDIEEEVKADIENSVNENNQKTQSFSQDFSNQIPQEENVSNIKYVRTDLNVLDSIIHSFDELLIRLFRFKHHLETLENQLNSQNQNKTQEFPQVLKEELNQYENSFLNVQHSIVELRMLPLNIILMPLKVEIENDAFRLGKNVELNIPESNLMLDKFILEHLQKILIQLVRNALIHGIEKENVREQIGKNPKGNITIKIGRIQNRMIINVIDDGQGFNYDKIRKKLREFDAFKNYTEDEINNMTTTELQEILFVNGFTTSSKVDNFSGRGIGLNIVRTEIEKIKGKIKITSQKNQGTNFELNIPLSLTSQQGLFITNGKLKFMLLSHYINEILDYSPENISIIQNQHYIKVNEKNIPLYFLSSILNTNSNENLNSVIIVEYLNTEIAIAIDSVEQYENVLINPLPKLLQNVEAFQGMVYDKNYSIIPILDIPYIIKKLKNLLSYEIKKYETFNETKKQRILVVDDSYTTRQIELSIFNSAGYYCVGASDGIEAFDILKSSHFDALVTDINMHRMDGLLLIKNIRVLSEFDYLPIVVLTGAYGKYDRAIFIEAGANAYLTKAEFKREKLLQTVRELLK